MLHPSQEELDSAYYDGFEDLADSVDDTIDRLEAELADVAVLRPVDGIQDPPMNEDATDHTMASPSQLQPMASPSQLQPMASPSHPIPSSSQARTPRTPLAASSSHRTVGFEDFGGGQGFSPSFDVPPPREKSEENLLSRVTAIEEALKGMARNISLLLGGLNKEEKEKAETEKAETETEKAEREKVEKEQASSSKNEKKRKLPKSFLPKEVMPKRVIPERKRKPPPRFLSPSWSDHGKKMSKQMRKRKGKLVEAQQVVKKLKLVRDL